MITFGGANKRDEIGDGEAERLARGRRAARRSAGRPRPRAAAAAPCCALGAIAAASCSLPRSGASTSAEHRSLGGEVGEPGAAAARRAHHEVAEIGTEAVGAAKQFAVVQDAEAEASLDADDEKIVEVARLAEPVLGERDEIDVAVDRRRRRRAGCVRSARSGRRARRRSGSAGTRRTRARTTPGRPTQTPAISFISSSASLTQRRTPSSTRSAITAGVCRSMRIGSEAMQHVGAEIGDGDCDPSGASLTPTTRAASGLSCSMTRGRPRPASRTAPICNGMMRPSSSSAAVIADTVVGLRSVVARFRPGYTGPKRRIASMTWKRLIARINSGSAVFIAGRGRTFRELFCGRPNYFKSGAAAVNPFGPEKEGRAHRLS